MFIIDPKDKMPSVSLTLLLATFALLVTASGLQIAGVVSNLSELPSLFWGCLSLYFGRRLNISGRSFASSTSNDLDTKGQAE